LSSAFITGALQRSKKSKGNFMHTVEEMMRAGCTTARGIRFWEDKGLFGAVERSSGGHRRYTPEQLDKAKIIAAAQFGGWSIEQIELMLVEWGTEAYEAIITRLDDQMRAAVRLGEALPKPAGESKVQEFDL
jgi:DNA-binding transcriptional MerR regulator